MTELKIVVKNAKIEYLAIKVEIKVWVLRIYDSTERLMCYISSATVTDYLFKWHYSWGNGYDPLCCRNSDRNMWSIWML